MVFPQFGMRPCAWSSVNASKSCRRESGTLLMASSRMRTPAVGGNDASMGAGQICHATGVTIMIIVEESKNGPSAATSAVPPM